MCFFFPKLHSKPYHYLYKKQKFIHAKSHVFHFWMNQISITGPNIPKETHVMETNILKTYSDLLGSIYKLQFSTMYIWCIQVKHWNLSDRAVANGGAWVEWAPNQNFYPSPKKISRNIQLLIHIFGSWICIMKIHIFFEMLVLSLNFQWFIGWWVLLMLTFHNPCAERLWWYSWCYLYCLCILTLHSSVCLTLCKW